MNLHELVSRLIVDTKGAATGGLSPTPDSSLGAFLPEVAICVTIVALLLVRLFNRRFDVFYIALIGTGWAFYLSAPWMLLQDPSGFERMEIFTGMLVYDGFTVFLRGVLLAFAVLFVLFTRLSGLPDREDGPDIYSLFLGATLGLCLMVSSNHLLMVFMAVEMASVPSYALAGMLKGRRMGSEAALKFSVFGAGAAGVMLYGISLVAGLLNSAHLPTLAIKLSERLPEMPSEELMVLALAGLMITVGLAYKLSAVPFHFWCPDVFEGATAEVNAFLSVASKAAALGLLVRLAIGFASLAPPSIEPGSQTAEQTVAEEEVASAAPAAREASGAGLFAVQDNGTEDVTAAAPEVAITAGNEAGLERARGFIGRLIAFLAVLTCTFGNLAAYGQSNIKRLLAYSTIAHAGYMMMAVPPIVALAVVDPAGSRAAAASLVIYLAVYLFMNLGAFAIVAFLRNEMRSEAVADYAGLIRRSKGIVICFSIILLSLVGLPPLAGFIGKFAIFAALADGYRGSGQAYLMALLIVGCLNTVLSLFYYLRVVRLMTMAPEPETRIPFSVGFLPTAFIVALTLPTALLLLGWGPLHEMALAAARFLVS